MEPLVVPVHDITLAVCESMDIPLPLITAYNKTPRVACAREMTWYIARELTDLSYPALARVFGRDHTTVLDGVRAFRKKMEEDPVLKQRAITVMAYLQRKERERWQKMNSARSMTSSARRPA